MLARDLSGYLYARSTGHFASLMALINRGCLRAIRSGHERLDEDLMNRVKNDAAAEKSRKEFEPRSRPACSAPARPPILKAAGSRHDAVDRRTDSPLGFPSSG